GLYPVTPPTVLLSPTAPHGALLSFPTRRSSDLPPMPMPRESSGALVGDFIIVPGGYRSHRADDSVDFFIPKENAWRSLPHLSRRSEEHTSELQSPYDLVCRLLLEKKKQASSSTA